MKLKINTCLVFFSFLFVSCLPSDEENARIGIMFKIINTTNLEYENVKVTIGGLENGAFVGTASYTLPTIRIRNNNSEAQYVAVDHNRWRPNLSLIQEISDKAYFTVQLEGKSPVLLYDSFDDNLIVSTQISQNDIIKVNYGGDLSINIHENSIKGRFFEQE